MPLVVGEKRRLVSLYGERRTEVTLKLFGIVPIARYSRPASTIIYPDLASGDVEALAGAGNVAEDIRTISAG